MAKSRIAVVESTAIQDRLQDIGAQATEFFSDLVAVSADVVDLVVDGITLGKQCILLFTRDLPTIWKRS